MPHSTVIKARQVLADPLNWPECVVTQAQTISDWYARRADTIRELWADHTVWQHAVRLRSKCLGTTILSRERVITKLLTQQFGRDRMGVYHRARYFIGQDRWNDVVAYGFVSAVQLVECDQHQLVLEWMRAVNARRYSPHLASVGFIKYVGYPQAAEILAWKIAHGKL